MTDGTEPQSTTDDKPPKHPVPATPPKEIGGPQGPEPMRYGDWEVNGRCIDF